MKRTWILRHLSLALWQLPILWFVLTISPNLNQWRGLWVLLTNYFLLYGAVTGFDIVCENKNYNGRSLVWFTAAGLYVTAAVLSLLKISMLYFVCVVFFGVIALGIFIFLNEKKMQRTFARSALLGVYSVFMLYAGINDLPLIYIIKWNVMLAGIVASLFYAAFLSAASNVRPDLDGMLASWVMLFLAITSTVFYFVSFLHEDYLYILSVFFVVAVIVLVLPVFRKSSKHLLLPGMSVLLIALPLNTYFLYLFISHTHILQLVE